MKKVFRFSNGQTVAEFAKAHGRSRNNIYFLLKEGYAEADILRVCNHVTLAEKCRKAGVPYLRVWQRVRKGMPLEEALRAPVTPYEERGKARHTYKGTSIRRMFTCQVYQKIVNAFNAGKGTIEQLVEREICNGGEALKRHG